MRLLFIVGSLEPGKDGVGDYTRRLAGECIRQGHSANIISLAERCSNGVREAQYESQADCDTKIACLRLHEELPWNRRIAEASTWLNALAPDWISCQFVPYSYHAKGLPWRLARKLRQISTGCAWTTTFHELALGLNIDASFKDRLIGVIQRGIVRHFWQVLSPRVAFTQCELYRQVLCSWGIEAVKLPLFGNVPVLAACELGTLLPARFVGGRNEYVLVGIFGNVESTEIVKDALDFIRTVVHKRGKKLGVLHLGCASTLTRSRLREVMRESELTEFVKMGPMDAADVSRVISLIDVGVVNTSEARAEKSGALAAFLDHDLPCVVSKRGWQPRGTLPFIAWEHRVVRVGNDEHLERELSTPRKPSERLPTITRAFIDRLSTLDIPGSFREDTRRSAAR